MCGAFSEEDNLSYFSGYYDVDLELRREVKRCERGGRASDCDSQIAGSLPSLKPARRQQCHVKRIRHGLCGLSHYSPFI